MNEFEIDWMFFIVLFLVFITAGLVTGKNAHDKKLEEKKKEEEELEENRYLELEKRVKVLEEKLL